MLASCHPSPHGETGADPVLETGAPIDDPPEFVPRAVVLFIGDGMGFEHVEGGGLYAHGEAGSLHMEQMPWSGRLRTASSRSSSDAT